MKSYFLPVKLFLVSVMAQKINFHSVLPKASSCQGASQTENVLEPLA